MTLKTAQDIQKLNYRDIAFFFDKSIAEAKWDVLIKLYSYEIALKEKVSTGNDSEAEKLVQEALKQGKTAKETFQCTNGHSCADHLASPEKNVDVDRTTFGIKPEDSGRVLAGQFY